MDISKKVYQQLTPKQRAVACYKSITRNDQSEIDRLLEHAPKHKGHGQTFLALGQAMDAYNLFTAKFTKDFLLINGRFQAAIAYCEGWLDAGGSVTDERYLERRSTLDFLVQSMQRVVMDIHSVRQAAREWCECNSIPIEFFSGPQCFLQLSESDGSVEPETLDVVRSVFAAIKLSW